MQHVAPTETPVSLLLDPLRVGLGHVVGVVVRGTVQVRLHEPHVEPLHQFVDGERDQLEELLLADAAHVARPDHTAGRGLAVVLGLVVQAVGL